ncbi:hypothetical protein Pmani_028913 [Petrolisthes manimaculis]|uniref:Uncharacterized protein n=1 Tax=Petrolisthes manimaculis TaxID=1843537 RepID=A0AAE1P156_9EUCA|nr:hypothetical protein Pmani_028913 [Petrolisthes manimaculis]
MLASLDSARQEVTHALATGAAMPLGRNYLRRLADCVHELAGLTFQTFVEAGIAARTAAKATPELAQRGVVKAGPLSPALCDQQAAQKLHPSSTDQTFNICASQDPLASKTTDTVLPTHTYPSFQHRTE